MPQVQITEPAKADIQQAYEWWAENRSAAQAAEWYERIFEAMATLQSMPERCPHVPESGLSRVGVRQLLFGIGSRPTHRIVFHFDSETDTVTVSESVIMAKMSFSFRSKSEFSGKDVVTPAVLSPRLEFETARRVDSRRAVSL